MQPDSEPLSLWAIPVGAGLMFFLPLIILVYDPFSLVDFLQQAAPLQKQFGMVLGVLLFMLGCAGFGAVAASLFVFASWTKSNGMKLAILFGGMFLFALVFSLVQVFVFN